jgi:hypothetical protein
MTYRAARVVLTSRPDRNEVMRQPDRSDRTGVMCQPEWIEWTCLPDWTKTYRHGMREGKTGRPG